MNEKTTKRAARTTRPSMATTVARGEVTPATRDADTGATQAAAAARESAGVTPQGDATAPAAPRKAPARAKTPAAANAPRKAAPRATRAAADAGKTGTSPKKAVATRAKKARVSPMAVAPAAAEAVASAAATSAAVAASSPTTPLSVLIVASEAAPFARSGGLGDLAGGLPLALGALGHRVTLVVPRYAGETRGVPVDRFPVPMGGHAEGAACYEVALGPNARAILVEHAGFFEREHLYGDGHDDYADNPRRFAFLCRAALEFASREGEPVDVVHAHDWQTALAPVFLRTEYAGAPALAGAASVLTIHDIAFQGLCAPEWAGMLGLAPELCSVDGLEFWGRLSFLKGGIVYSDAACTLGTAYARQLASGERASGFEGILAARGGTFFGVVDDEAPGAGTDVLAMDEVARRFAEVFAAAHEARTARV